MQSTTDGLDRAMTSGLPEPDFGIQLREELGAADVRYVLDLFVGDLHRLTDGVRQAAASEEAHAMSRALHALAGAAGAVGASELERSCRKVMTILKHDPTHIAEHFPLIEQASAAAEQALARVRAEVYGGDGESA